MLKSTSVCMREVTTHVINSFHIRKVARALLRIDCTALHSHSQVVYTATCTGYQGYTVSFTVLYLI